MLLCDGCDGGHHFFCVGLKAVPSGEWWCSVCEAKAEAETEAAAKEESPSYLILDLA